MPIDEWIFVSGRDCGRTALRLGRPYGAFGMLYRLMNRDSLPEESTPQPVGPSQRSGREGPSNFGLVRRGGERALPVPAQQGMGDAASLQPNEQRSP